MRPNCDARFAATNRVRKRSRVAQFGLRPLPSVQALATLGLAVAPDGPTQVAVAHVDWQVLVPAYAARRARPFLSLVEPTTSQAFVEVPIVSDEQPALVRALAVARTGDRADVAQSIVRDAVVRTLGLATSRVVDPDQGLFELGMDSLMSVALKGRLEATVGRALPSTLTSNNPSINALSGFLLAELAPQVPTPAAPTVESSDDLSEDNLAQMLAARLARRN